MKSSLPESEPSNVDLSQNKLLIQKQTSQSTSHIVGSTLLMYTIILDQQEWNTQLSLIVKHWNINASHINLLCSRFVLPEGDRVNHLLGPSGHLLTPALVYVRLLQELPGDSKSQPTN